MKNSQVDTVFDIGEVFVPAEFSQVSLILQYPGSNKGYEKQLQYMNNNVQIWKGILYNRKRKLTSTKIFNFLTFKEDRHLIKAKWIKQNAKLFNKHIKTQFKFQ